MRGEWQQEMTVETGRRVGVEGRGPRDRKEKDILIPFVERTTESLREKD